MEEVNIAVIGDDLDDWLSAAGFSMLGLKTALMLGRVPDLEVPPFVELPIDPSRSEYITDWLGLEPAAGPLDPYEADFQVILPEQRIDFFSDPEMMRFGLERDMPDQADPVLNLIADLHKLARDLEQALRNLTGFPPLRFWDRVRWFFRKRQLSEEISAMSFDELCDKHGVLQQARLMIRAVIQSMNPRLPADLPAIQAAMLFQLVGRLGRGKHADVDLREGLADIISARGRVVAEWPEGISISGKQIQALRLAEAKMLRCGFLTGASHDLFGILDSIQREDRSAQKLAARFARSVRHTLFLMIDNSEIPEGLAQRSVLIADTDKPMVGKNLLVLTRWPQTAKVQHLAVTLGYNKGDVQPPGIEDIVESLSVLLPWLDHEKIELDPSRETVSRYSYSRLGTPFLKPRLEKPPLGNMIYPPAEILPGWGIIGLKKVISSLHGLIPAEKT